MHRVHASYLTALLLAIPTVAFGQTEVGAGTYLDGLGWYNLNTAKANSINVDAAIRWKSDLRKIQAEGRNRRALQTAGFKGKADEARRQLLIRDEQIRTNPTANDIYTGDALDLLMFDLTDPNIEFESWRAKPVALPDGMSVKDMIFKFTPISGSSQSSVALGNGVIALSRLDIHGKWPTALDLPELAAQRITFESEYAKVKEEILAGKLSVKTLLQMDASLKNLRDQAEISVPKERGFRVEAIRFVDDLRDATRMFDASTVDYASEILLDTKDHDAKTVAELIAFMQKYRLQFASAERHPSTRELYAKLYAAMREQAGNLETKAVEPMPGNDPANAVAIVGLKWEGILVAPDLGGASDTLKCSVIARNKDKITLLCSQSAGTTWEMDCEFVNDKEFTIMKVRNLRGNGRSAARPAPWGDIVGKGEIDGKSITAEWYLPRIAKSTSRISGTITK